RTDHKKKRLPSRKPRKGQPLLPILESPPPPPVCMEVRTAEISSVSWISPSQPPPPLYGVRDSCQNPVELAAVTTSSPSVRSSGLYSVSTSAWMLVVTTSSPSVRSSGRRDQPTTSRVKSQPPPPLYGVRDSARQRGVRPSVTTSSPSVRSSGRRRIRPAFRQSHNLLPLCTEFGTGIEKRRGIAGVTTSSPSVRSSGRSPTEEAHRHCHNLLPLCTEFGTV
ncbi:MAG: hypothetical protein G01um101438_707, partial [Parcubacteria group bacterium Gr01-1014_38]